MSLSLEKVRWEWGEERGEGLLLLLFCFLASPLRYNLRATEITWTATAETLKHSAP